MTKHYWTTTEHRYMQQHYGFVPVREIAEAIGRSEDAIRWYASRIGLRSKLPSKPRVSSDAIKALLYEGLSAPKIAARLGVDRRSITERLHGADFDDTDRAVARVNGRRRK